MKTALIIVDIQNDYFLQGKWELVGMYPAAQNAKNLLEAFREKGCPIFHIQHVAKDPNAPFFVEGTEGVEIHKLVQPIGNEKVVLKEFANSFRDTSLLDDLHGAGVKRVVICGGMTQNCIDSTTRAAFDLGFECVVVHDACATRNLVFYGHIIPALEVHCAFMAALDFAYAKVVPTISAIALIESN
ncbi:cysteine hydrolase family protein [Limnofasciculus baicalensis]|uniref:Cysteine hydrolase n=1 Tax=Limnofasciculus baicalensis BBK-W-15 TaxID=2699891 RepID=A0AAE3GNT9_9CYAN|nr:cysteine hydrolase family protein [Limnofasciculus baicalensis]MCP2727317.1 cysteine hydrolase [Limnofasciculus baicalensis BBK-W-15]